MSEWKYDLVILQAGGQHGLGKRCSDDFEYAARYKENYIELMDMVLGYCDNIMLLSATPTVEMDNLDKLWEERNREIAARNNIVKEIGEEKGIKYIDIFTPLLNCDFVHTDYIHFDKESNMKIANIIYKEIERQRGF